MSSSLPTNPELPAISAKLERASVELCLLGGVDAEGLNALFVALWMEDQFRIILECSHVAGLTSEGVRTLARFSKEFSCRGGFVRLAGVSDRIRAVLEALRCDDLLSLAPSTASSSAS